jgi:hypothetical protein
VTIERRLEALERTQDPASYRVFREPEGISTEQREAWRASMRTECERDDVTPIVVVREHDAAAS